MPGDGDVELGAPATTKAAEEEKGGGKRPSGDTRLAKMGLMTALAVGLHNFPEGLATFVATLDDPSVGGALAVAIAMHNIPEGMCVAIPVFYATGSRWKGFWFAAVSGLAEPVGALLGYLLLKDAMGPMVYGVMFGVIAGMMVYICVRELLPTAHRYDPKDNVTSKGIFAGMFFMALSLVLFVLEPENAATAALNTTVSALTNTTVGSP